MPDNRKIVHSCTTCGREVGKANLKVKRVQFLEPGNSGAVIKTRTISWLCITPQEDGSPSCLEADADWNRPLYSAAPGLADTRIASANT